MTTSSATPLFRIPDLSLFCAVDGFPSPGGRKEIRALDGVSSPYVPEDFPSYVLPSFRAGPLREESDLIFRLPPS